MLIKDSKLKVQVAIQEEMLRVTGKKKDDLQAAMCVLTRPQISASSFSTRIFGIDPGYE